MYKNLPDTYESGTNEAGLHLNKGTNFAADILIFGKDILAKPLTNQFVNIPPKVVIEVDTLADFQNPLAYYHAKTEKLLNFGVQKVIWVTTESRKIKTGLSRIGLAK